MVGRATLNGKTENFSEQDHTQAFLSNAKLIEKAFNAN
jgi:hypothetical protein